MDKKKNSVEVDPSEVMSPHFLILGDGTFWSC